MITIFEVRNGKLTLTEDALSYKALRAIWDDDSSDKKEKAMDAFYYIYHTLDPRSGYAGMKEEHREESVKRNELRAGFKKTKLIEAGYQFYKMMIYDADPIFPLVQAAKGAVYKLEQYYNNVDPHDEKFKITDLTKTLKDMSGLIKSYQELEVQVTEKAKVATTRTRANREINPFEI